MWENMADGTRHFRHGDEAPELAARAALACGRFQRDDEEECFFDEPVTCYNCRWRRWTADSFTCLRRDG